MKNYDYLNEYKLNKETPIPLYYQISSILREQILSGKLSPGDQILTEEKLQKVFGVSRATVRRAISDLVYDGLLERHFSKGTIVTQPKLEESLSTVGSFTLTTMQGGKTLVTKLLKFEEIECDGALHARSDFELGCPLYHIRRLRFIDGRPVCIEDAYIPRNQVPDLDADTFTEDGPGQSTYYLFQTRYNIYIKSIEDAMTAVALNQEDARLLNKREGTPVLLRQRLSFDQAGRLVLFSSGKYIIQLKVSLP